MKKRALLVAFTVVSACASHNESFFEFDPRSLEKDSITLAQFCDSIFYIPLDNNISLGLIHDNLKYNDKSFYFSSFEIGILEFDRNGQYIRKIGSIGRGPGEYTYYTDFIFDENNNTIYVQDRSDLIKVYSRSGNFIRSISLQEADGSIEKIGFLNSKIFAFKNLQNGGSLFNWIVYDTLGNIIKTKNRTIPNFKCGWAGGCGTYIFESKLSYWNIYNDSVYSILPDLNYKISFILKPGEHRLPYSDFEPSSLAQYMHIWQILETERFYTILYTYKKPFFALVDKRSRDSFLASLEFRSGSTGLNFIGGICNDLDGGMEFLPKSYFQEKGREYLVGIIYPYQIKIHVSCSKFINSIPKYPEKKKEFEKLANTLMKTDNPVLMIVRLRK